MSFLTPVVELTAGTASAALFAAASAVRRARTFHPDGAAFSATVTVPPATDPVLPAGEHPAIVRFSRGAGLPEPMIDILGLALRLVDLHGPGQHQDLLLVTSGDGPGARHALLPGRSFGHERWSSILPYAVGASRRRVVFGAAPVGGERQAAAGTLNELRAAARAGAVRYSLDVASVTGAWEPVATLVVGEERTATEAEGLRFNPANAGGGIEPVGLVQAVRRFAYLGSQAGRSGN